MEKKSISRRGFLQNSLVSGAALGAVGANAQAQAVTGQEGEAAAEAANPAEKVPRKLLGQTGEEIPILLLGCSQKFNRRFDKILHHSVEQGVDYLDTALVYADGQSHATIATFLEQIEDRKKVWITSKAPTWLVEPTVEGMQKDFDSSLEGLKTDYTDMYFMHGVNDMKLLDKPFLDWGDKLRKTKKTRFFGFSTHGNIVPELMNKAAKVGGIDAIMFAYNFSKYGDKELNKAIDACVEAGIGLIAMKTQKSVPKRQEEVVQFESKNFSLAQAKLKAVWADERITSAVSLMDSVEKVDENVAAAKSPVKLGMTDFHQLNRLYAHIAPYSCQGCSHICESRVASNVPIADTLRYLMYGECYGELDKARGFYRQLRSDQRALDGVDFSAATHACPEGIDIAARLHEARKLLA